MIVYALNVIGSWIQAVGSILSLLGANAEPDSDDLGRTRDRGMQCIGILLLLITQCAKYTRKR